MKQTLEEAAKEELIHSYSNKYSGNGTFEYGQEAMLNMFLKGAEWHAKQSPWISVEEQPANIYDDFLVTDGKKIYKAYNNGNNKWYIADRLDKYRLEGIIAYMPIPSFDEILEANRDIIERIKEKGD